MTQLSSMEFNAEFLRGWPVAEPTAELNIKSGAGYSSSNGDLVSIQADGTIAKVAATLTDDASLAIVVRGDNDRIGTTAGHGGTTPPNIVLMGNYVVRTSNIETGAAVGSAVPVVGRAVSVSANGLWCAVDATATVKAGICTALTDVTLKDGSAGKSATIVVR